MKGSRAAGWLGLKALLLALIIYAGLWVLFFALDTLSSTQPERVDAKIFEHAGKNTCRALSWRSAPKGVILELQCRSPVAGVIREVKPHVVAPVPFTRVPTGNNTFLILVEYPFRPQQELYVAAITESSRTWSMSPYFPAKPDATDAQYDELARSPQARRYGKAESLKMLRRVAPDLPETDLDPPWR